MDRVRFLHIPKTAGLSFYDALERLYAAPSLFLDGDWRQNLRRFQSLDEAARDRIVLVGGHAPRITGDPFIDSLPTVTLLRDPVRRVQSFCHHVHEGKSPYLRDVFPPDRFDLDAFLRSGDAQLANMQTRMLLGDRCLALPGGSPEELAAQAVDVLMHDIECFGIVERLADSLELFRRVLRWPHTPPVPRLNARRETGHLRFTDGNIATIRELNAIDIAVYDAAKALFEERVAFLDADADRSWLRPKARAAWRRVHSAVGVVFGAGART